MNYTEEKVVQTLSKNPNIRFFGHTIQVVDNPDQATTVGNGSWGKLDFLQAKGYIVDRVKELTKREYPSTVRESKNSGKKLFKFKKSQND